MTRAETDLLLRLSQDTNSRVTALDLRLSEHLIDDTKKFAAIDVKDTKLSTGLERNDTRWRILHWAFWPTLGMIASFLGYRVLH